MEVKTAILCRNTCQTAPRVLEVFSAAGLAIDLVVVETRLRRRFSDRELRQRASHREFLRRGGAAASGSLLRRAWDRLPRRLQDMARCHAHRLPVLRRIGASFHAHRHGVEVVRVKRHSSRATVQVLERHEIDLVLLVSSGWLIREPLLSMEGTRIINAHPAKLPEHRSLDAPLWSILAGSPSGVTTHFVDAGIDTGPILSFFPIPLREGETLTGLDRRLAGARPQAFLDTVLGLREGRIEPREQRIEDGEHHRPMTLDELQQVSEVLERRASLQPEVAPAAAAGEGR